MKAIDWRTQNEPVRSAKIGAECATINEADSLTQQHFAESADINVLVQRFGLDKGPIPHVPFNPEYYGDFTDVPDLRTALDLVNDAKNRFMALPAKLRARFHNSPGELWHFVNDPENGEESVRLGLLQRQPVAEQQDTPLGEGGTGT
nr:MAG: internal scaffolding protein [Microvirus sp.]